MLKEKKKNASKRKMSSGSNATKRSRKKRPEFTFGLDKMKSVGGYEKTGFSGVMGMKDLLECIIREWEVRQWRQKV